MKMTAARIAAARARCEAATEGDWYAIGGDCEGHVGIPDWHLFTNREPYENAAADANFMAAAHTDLPQALDDLATLHEFVEAVRGGRKCDPRTPYDGESLVCRWCATTDLCKALAALDLEAK